MKIKSMHFGWSERSAFIADSVPRSYMRGEGRSLAAGLREQASNSHKLRWSKVKMLSIKGETWQRLRQMKFKETRAKDH